MNVQLLASKKAENAEEPEYTVKDDGEETVF